MNRYHRFVMLVALLALLVPALAPAPSSLMGVTAPSHVYAQSRTESSSQSPLLTTSMLDTPLVHSSGSSMSSELSQNDDTFTIEDIEINQVLGYQLNGNLTFVAGKQTAIRAFLSQEVEVSADMESTYAVIKRDGNEVTTLAAKSYDKPTKVVDFLCPSMEQCGSWAAGTYTFNVAVNDVTKNTEDTSYVFENRRQLRVLAVAITERLGDRIVSMPNDEWKKTWAFTQRVYPLAEGSLKWKVREQPLDLSGVAYDLNDSNKQCEVWQALRNLIPDNCAANPDQEGCVDQVVGYIWENPPGLAGFTCGAGATIVVARDQDVQATVAHEIAHKYGIGDTYNGGSYACNVNPAPSFGCTPGSTANGDAALVPASHHPYEVGGRGALGDMKCYMGSGGQQEEFWTTQETYNHLFGKFAPKATAMLQQAEPQRLVAVEGFVTKDGRIDLDPWYTFTDTLTLEDTESMTPTSDIVFMVEGLDSSGQQVVTKTLDVSFNVFNNPPSVLEWAPFEEVLPFPDSVTQFNIISSTLEMTDVDILKTVFVSPNAPEVSSVYPTESGMTITGPYTTTWTGFDADSSDMIYQSVVPVYTVEYNPDVTNSESDWIVLASNLTVPQWSDDFAELPGGNHAKIRVTMSDGLLTSEAESAEFVVPPKAPEVFIEPPEWGYDYEESDEVILEADVYDLQDEWLDDDKLVWTSNLSGTLGTGTDLIVDNLPIGDHTITLTATNSAGLTASDSITLSIGTVSYEYIPYPAVSNEIVVNRFERNQLTTDGRLQAMVEVPASAIYTDTFVTYWHERQPANSTPPDGYEFVDRSFSLSFDVADGDNWNEVTTLAAGSGVTVSLEYQSILPNNTTPMSLTLFRWDDTAQTWIDAASECSPASTYNREYMDMIEVRVCRAGMYTLAGQTMGWRRIFSESFDSFPNAWWQVTSTGSDPNITWGTTDYDYDALGNSKQSVWPAAGGANRVDINETNNYPPNLGSWMIAGPFDLTHLQAAELYYSQLSEMEENDWAAVCVTAESTDPVADFAKPEADCSWWTDATGVWDIGYMDLEAYAGKANVSIGWYFESDASNASEQRGLFIDEIELWGADVSSAALDDFADWVELYNEPFDQLDLTTNPSWKLVTNQSGLQWSTTATQNDSYTNPTSTKAATAVTPGSGYPAGLQTWIIYGPLDVQTKEYADVSFSVNYDLVFADENDATKNDWLGFCVGTSADPTTYDYEGCEWWTGSTENDWEDAYADLSSYAGNSNVYIGWVLLSNVGSTTKAGAFVDELSIWAQESSVDDKLLSFDTDGLLIKNGAFDTGLTNWSATGSVTTTIEDGNPAASLAGTANLYQPFKVPTGASDVMVSFAYAFTSTETVVGNDIACVSITPQSNPTPTNVNDILVDFGCWDVTDMPDFAMQDQQFDYVTFNLTEQEMSKVYTQTVALNIELMQDTAVSGTTTLYVDDVVVYTTGASRRNAGQNDGKGAQRDPNEPNDSTTTATNVSCGQTIDATFGDVGGGADDDYYKLVRLPQGKVGIDIDADTLRPSSKVDSHLVLSDAQGTQIAENDDDSKSTDSLLVYNNPTDNATLIVQAFSWTEPERGVKTSYKLKVTCGDEVPPAPGSNIGTTPVSFTLSSNLPAIAPVPMAIPEQPHVQANKKAWTAILYLNGEDQKCVQNEQPDSCWDKNYEQSITGIEEFIAQKQDFLNVVVLLDGPNYGGVASDVRRYVVQPNGQYTEGVNKWALPEANLGDPQVFADFVKWAMVNYPAEHYFVSIDDHGDGIQGIGWDHTGADGAKIDDQITPTELRAALKDITNQGQRKIDIFDYEACLMGMVENAYDLKEYVSYVAFFQPISWTSLNYPEYLRDMQQTDDALTVGKRIIQTYPVSQQPYSFALIDLSAMSDVRQKLDAFADALRNVGENDKLAQVRDTVQAFNGEPDKGNAASDGTYLDIVDLADKVAAQGIATAEAAALRTAVTAAVMQTKAVKSGTVNDAVWDYSNFHGLSVYYPKTQTTQLNNYQKSYLMTRDGTWDEFLTYFFTGKQPTRPSNVPEVLEEKPDPDSASVQVINVVYLPIVERATASSIR